MTDKQLKALLQLAGSTEVDGWQQFEDRHVTLYVAKGGVSLTVGRVTSLRIDGDLLHALTSKGETYVLEETDVFAASVEGQSQQTRRAGFAQ